uniref:Uncharacterized protein n=1 Tax=candidate division WOR-3 bacterium TaxID=2052148 RepID=A0A7C4XFG2_UNCW3
MKNLDPKEVKKRIDQWAELSEFSLEILRAFFRKKRPEIKPSSIRLKIFERLHPGLRDKWQGSY